MKRILRIRRRKHLLGNLPTCQSTRIIAPWMTAAFPAPSPSTGIQCARGISTTTDPSPPKTQPHLRLPPKIRSAERPETIIDPDYTPAESGDGLEVVGGFEGWWDNQTNWSPARDFRGFGPQEKIRDQACLHVLTRMAVIEALAVQQTSGSKAKERLIARWHPGSPKSLTLTLRQTVQVKGDRAWLDGSGQKIASTLGRKDNALVEHIVDPEKARKYLNSMDDTWQKVSLRDLWLKFAVAKRIFQLTGHVVPDSKLAGVRTAEDLLKLVLQPPKPKKLAENPELRSQLEQLPNVQVHSARVTPIDKEKAVGRWKVITEELEKRNLPVTGIGNYGPHVEKTWLAEPLKRKGFHRVIVDGSTPGRKSSDVRGSA